MAIYAELLGEGPPHSHRMRRTGAAPWALLAVLALGAALRLLYLGRESLWYDETYSVYWAQRSLWGDLSDVHPPLYNALLHFWMQLFGTSEAAARSLSALFGMASIYLTYRVASTLFDRRVGLVAAFLSSFSLLGIHYSMEARSYSLLLMLSLLSYLYFVRIIQGDRSKTSFLFYVMSNTLMVYTHLFGLFILASQVVYLALFRWRAISVRFVVAQAVTAALFLPWLSNLFSGDRLSRLAWLQEPTFGELLSTLKAHMGNLSAIAPYAGKPQLVPLQQPLFYLFLLMSLVGLFSGARLTSLRRRRFAVFSEGTPGAPLLLVWLVTPILLPFFISRLFMPIYILRYTIAASPALFILVALGICRWKVTAVALSISGLFLFLSLPALSYYYTHPHKEQWREAAQLVEKNAAEGDAVVVNCDGPEVLPPLEYYHFGSIEPVVLRATDWSPERVGAFLERVSQDKERLWLVSSYGQGSQAVRDLLKQEYRLIQTNEFVGLSVDLFFMVEGNGQRTAPLLHVPVHQQPLGQIEAEPDGCNTQGQSPPVAVPLTV